MIFHVENISSGQGLREIMAWTLCTKEDVVDLHPIPVGDIKDSWSDMVEGLIREHLDAPYLGLPTAITDEWHDGDGSNILMVNKPSIVSVEALQVNGLFLSAGDYVVFPTYIELKTHSFTRGPLMVKVSYTSGSSEVSQVIRMAVVAMIIAIINYRKRAGADASVKWGTADQKVGEQTPNMNVGLTSHLETIMKRTLRRTNIRAR